MPSLPTFNDVVAKMRQALAITEPDLDTSVGTPVRKIIDAVGEVIMEGQVDTYLLNYLYDIESKTGADLDNFVQLFGFTRLGAKRASGNITFARNTPATDDYYIPAGTQVATTDLVPVIAQTLAAGIMYTGESEVELPAQVIVGGNRGNVQAGALTVLTTQVAGITSVSNTSSFVGGVNAESDVALRSRFKKTVFRNLAGTEQMFKGVALEDPSVVNANVVGPTKHHFEQIELVNGVGISMVQDSAYAFPDSSFFGESIRSGDILTPNVHYLYQPFNQPVISAVDGSIVPDGVYELEFDYLSSASRNSPHTGVTNRVDVWLNGVRQADATETLIWSTAYPFNNTITDPLYYKNFQRLDNTNPTPGNYFIRYGFSPVLNPCVLDKITIGATDYLPNQDFWLVNDITAWGMAPRSRSGIEWKSTGTLPDNNSTFTLTYRFNEAPLMVQAAIDQWRLVTTDVWVHQAKMMYLKIHLAVIVAPGWDIADIDTDIGQAFTDYLTNRDFNDVVQVSDLLAVAHSLTGVDAVRFMTSADDPVNFGIAHVTPEGVLIKNYNDGGTVQRAVDIPLGDDEVAVLFDVTLDRRAQNTFGVV